MTARLHQLDWLTVPVSCRCVCTLLVIFCGLISCSTQSQTHVSRKHVNAPCSTYALTLAHPTMAWILLGAPTTLWHLMWYVFCSLFIASGWETREALGSNSWPVPDCSFLSCCHPKQSLNHCTGFPGRYVTLLVMMSRHRYLSNQIAVFSI